MRVIAGTARGRELKAPKGLDTRPMMDIVKGSLFNMLESLDGIGGRTLDLFAGSGSLGIEALSRGAESVDFVEQNREACRIIGENLERLKFAPQGRVLAKSVAAFLGGPAPAESYELVFVDAPYPDKVSENVLEWLARPGWLSADALVCVGHHKREALSETVGTLSQIKYRCFGASCISIYLNSTLPVEMENS